jgi:hypothetical protein
MHARKTLFKKVTDLEDVFVSDLIGTQSPIFQVASKTGLLKNFVPLQFTPLQRTEQEESA